MSVPSDSDQSDGRDRHGDGATASAESDEDNDSHNGMNAEYFEVKPILKRKSLDETEIKTLPSILKKRDSFDLSSKQTFPKRHSLGSESDQRNPLFVTSSGVRDIASTPSSAKPLSQIHSILKHKSFDEKFFQTKDDHNLPKPILKKNLSIEDQIEKSLSLKNGTNGANTSTLSPSHSTKSILKAGSDDKLSTNKPFGVKSILKNKNDRNDAKPVKSALKKSDQSLDNKDSKMKSILKSESMGSSTERIDSYDSSSSSSCEDLLSIDQTLETNESSAETDNRNGHSVIDGKPNEEKKTNERFLSNNKKLDHKRPSSCIFMSAIKPIDIDVDTEKDNPKETETRPQNGSSRQSISERLAALKQNGEEMWKKRVQKDDEMDVQLRAPTNASNRARATSIADRLSLLEDSSLKWKNRVEEKDVKKFTIEGKMSESDAPVLQTPEVQRKTPKAKTFRSEKTQDLLNSIKKDQIIVPKLITPQPDSQTPNSSTNNKKEIVVSILKPDDEDFNSFFTKEVKHKNEENESISDDVFNEISAGVCNLLKQKKLVNLQRPRRMVSSNPIRSLAARTDFIVNSYVESASNQSIANSDSKVTKARDMAKTSSFAPSALAGLASREDIKAVAGKLRNSSASTRDVWKSYDMPNSMQNLMLVQVKGRRRAQTRLVEPKLSSINSGDSYILVSKDNLIVWIGQYSNVIERTKTLEIANTIQEKKDLCFRSSNPLILIDNQKPEMISKKSEQLFLKVLNANPDQSIDPSKSPEEDELYEEVIIGTNLIYRVNNEQLVPYDSYWGRLPKYEMLSSDEAFVFDFGSEMYVWVGNKTSNIVRKCALDSAKELWKKGYDYSECDINPMGVSVAKKADKRPEWTWFMKVSQNMESVLFREKFVNWPSATPSAPTAVKSKISEKLNLKDIYLNIPNIDVKELIEWKAPEPDLILENSHLGRGVRWDDELEGRHISITFLAAKCWLISDYEKHELSDEDKNYFYSGDTYVVRWHYRIARVGRELKTGNESRHSLRGRDRSCYFFWHGIGTKSTEKGASALMTIELDKEKAQQVRVSERKEEPCFLNIFKGAFAVLLGKRGQPVEKNWRMFYVRGLFPNEASLVEVECKVDNLRSRTSFLFISASNHLIYLWKGSKCLDHIREVTESAVENLIKYKSSEMGLKSGVNYFINRLDEGKEVKEFWDIFGLSKSKESKDYRKLYHSLIDSHLSFSYTPRLFHLSSSSGEFKPKEILCSLRSNDRVNAYPFLQEDLYSAQQPTFFMLDDERLIFLWESKFAFTSQTGVDSEANTTIGSANIRWNIERKCALDFTLAYSSAKNSAQPPNAYVVCAGLEPDSFCALFPEWKSREDVALIHIEDGRKPGEMIIVKDILSQLKEPGSVRYSLQELKRKPEGVNPLCLESYLSDEDFKEALGMSREEFYGLADWRQTSLKQSAQLF